MSNTAEDETSKLDPRRKPISGDALIASTHEPIITRRHIAAGEEQSSALEKFLAPLTAEEKK